MHNQLWYEAVSQSDGYDIVAVLFFKGKIERHRLEYLSLWEKNDAYDCDKTGWLSQFLWKLLIWVDACLPGKKKLHMIVWLLRKKNTTEHDLACNQKQLRIRRLRLFHK